MILQLILGFFFLRLRFLSGFISSSYHSFLGEVSQVTLVFVKSVIPISTGAVRRLTVWASEKGIKGGNIRRAERRSHSNNEKGVYFSSFFFFCLCDTSRVLTLALHSTSLLPFFFHVPHFPLFCFVLNVGSSYELWRESDTNRQRTIVRHALFLPNSLYSFFGYLLLSRR